MTAHLLIGPVLRRVVGTRATIWVETSDAATVRVEVEGGGTGTATTFAAYGHHYALVVVTGLTPGTSRPYRVLVDDREVWPAPGSAYPQSEISTRPAEDDDGPVRLIFGSCREATPSSSTRQLPPDALDAYARRLMTDPSTRPDLIVLLGDQVYADNTSAKVRRFLKRRRAAGHQGPADQVVTFDEYTKLYLESWRDPEIRWLFATVPSVMIFDDHELIDDWNTSQSWRADMAAQSWWAERIAGGLASYWVYQHLGNLSPDDLAADPLYQKVSTAEDATVLLHEFGRTVDTADVNRFRWSFALDLGRTRLVMLDNRCNRVLTPGAREMLPAAEWQWFVDQAHGDYDHLVVGSSLPWLMPPAIHYLEAWNERRADSDHPRVAARAEKIRRAFDLEHWAAFGRSFAALGELFRHLGDGDPDAPGDRVGAGGAYRPPATISVLSGDVHHSYVAEAELGTNTPVMQLTCSPVHNQVPAFMRPLMRFSWSRLAARGLRTVARTAGVRAPAWRWKRLAGPYFGNAVSSLLLAGRSATVRVEGTSRAGDLFSVAEVSYPRQDDHR
ncbi:alkaline phosphatase family protein [Actinoplanes sp. KI2]|uniref:alkaline phosphatase D family protein n=1 Tax=Actinoplanes sp. KI2 TaxID=2983315 RepID=UPI0021D5B889|nr:alkaline phosphatase D family protein [Actinoplanes sp. KI2]MCU7723673.1 alkaline phosphatase family protein [Actinoplanes sp. KI2]